MPSDTPPRQTPRAVKVVVRVVPAGDAARRATIEIWTPAGNALAPQPADDPDLNLVLSCAATVSSALGLHGSFEFVGEPDEIGEYVQSWSEKRNALDEVRCQRALLAVELKPGRHRSDGTLRTGVDRADAATMLERLNRIRKSLLQRGFAIESSTA